MYPDHVLVKTNTDNSHWQIERCSDREMLGQRDAQTIEVHKAYTLLR